MKIHKYRDFSNPNEDSFRRLEGIIHRHLVWCAKADTLNDQKEFIWECDYTATQATLGLVTELLVNVRGRTQDEARSLAESAIRQGRLQPVAEPVFVAMIEQCRNEIGLGCFGSTPNNEVLWQRYGGEGAGVCVEFEVPDDLIDTQLHWVKYLERKYLHVDDLIRAFFDRNHAQLVYEVALLSKPLSWAGEEEIRFVSQRHSISVGIDRAQTSRVFLGDRLKADVRARVEKLAAPAPLAERC